MTDKTLYILAGYSGSGKSTLLTQSLTKGIPLFGKEDQGWLTATRLPASLPEHQTALEDILRRGSWFAETHLPALAQLENPPDSVVVHIDLNQLASSSPNFPNLRSPLRDLLPRTVNSLMNPDQNLLFFRHALSNPFLSRFDRIVINTLVVPWEDISAQWNRRRISRKASNQGGLSGFRAGSAAIDGLRSIRQCFLNFLVNLNYDRPLKRKRYLFDFRKPGKAIHDSIYQAWFSAVAERNPGLALMTEFQEGRLVIRNGEEIIHQEPIDPTAWSTHDHHEDSGHRPG